MITLKELDLLAIGSEDCNVYVYGYNDNEVEVNQSPSVKNDSVSNRVSGMMLKYKLKEHKDPVSSVVCFFRDGTHWMLSTGWDRRICLWDVREGKLVDVFRHSEPVRGALKQKKEHILPNITNEELCADDIVLGIDYSPEMNEFCYCSADKQAYVRKFSQNGGEMTLRVVLQGHDGDVTMVKWHKMGKNWITASEDRTIRIWV